MSGARLSMPSGMFKRIGTMALGLLLLPLCAGFTWQLGSTLAATDFKPDAPYYFTGGFLAYLAVHLLFRKPILTYVFAHEMTHALFAVLFGGSVKAFHATERGGQVTITKSNFVITLAPYFFPLYTFVALVLHVLLSASAGRWTSGVLVFSAGATFAFHLALTLIFLAEDQQDIREHGAFFSLPLIYMFNVVFAALLINVLLARKNGFLEFLGHGIIRGTQLSILLYSKIAALLR